MIFCCQSDLEPPNKNALVKMVSTTLWALFSIITYTVVGAIEYPPGVDPNACPNYPFCSSITAESPNTIPLASNKQYSYQPQPYNFQPYQPPTYSSRQYQPQQYQPQQYQYQPEQYQPQQYQPKQYQPQQYQPQQRQSQQYQGQLYQPQQQQESFYQPSQLHQISGGVNQYDSVQGRSYNAAQGSQYSADIQKALDRGEYIGDGDYHGEGLAEALAPGYEGNSQARSFEVYSSQSVRNTAYNPAQAAPSESARYPAGVDPKSCPNYPFCS